MLLLVLLAISVLPAMGGEDTFVCKPAQGIRQSAEICQDFLANSEVWLQAMKEAKKDIKYLKRVRVEVTIVQAKFGGSIGYIRTKISKDGKMWTCQTHLLYKKQSLGEVIGSISLFALNWLVINEDNLRNFEAKARPSKSLDGRFF